MNDFVTIFPFYQEMSVPGSLVFSRRTVERFYPLHGHDYYEMELIVGGKGRQWINNTCVPLSAGSLYLLSLSDVHRVEAETPLDVISMHFLADEAERMGFGEMRSAYFCQLAEEEKSLFLRLAEEAEDASLRRLPYADRQMAASAMLMLTHLMRFGERYSPTESTGRMRRVLDYLHTGYRDSALRLSDAAGVCGLSPCHFSSVFHETVGCGFSEYLMRYRIQQACILLSAGGASVTDTAYAVGFASLPHFFRTFRAFMGCTPRKFQAVSMSDSPR